jgi:hypothetical protein
MKTKDVLLIAGGVALGFLATRMSLGRKTANAVGNAVTGATGVATGLVTDVKDIAVDAVKLAECEKKWSTEIGSVSRFASAQAMEQSKADYIKKCSAS